MSHQNVLFCFEVNHTFQVPNPDFLCTQSDATCQNPRQAGNCPHSHTQNETSIFLMLFQGSVSDLRSLLSRRQDSM